ncbi:MAG TPA: PLDc N-terminal domain-containing protein [Desulfobacteria bacterium]|nr:PLDc N-terminal domain-containing protein [Desulfobacteria bacterium]
MTPNWSIIAPLAIIQLLLQIIALVDISRRPEVVGGRKWPWVLVIVIFGLLGSAVYLLAGRKEA